MEKNNNINWNEVLINATISSAQGIMESGHIGQILELDPNIISIQSIHVAKSLVEHLKKEIENK